MSRSLTQSNRPLDTVWLWWEQLGGETTQSQDPFHKCGQKAQEKHPPLLWGPSATYCKCISDATCIALKLLSKVVETTNTLHSRHRPRPTIRLYPANSNLTTGQLYTPTSPASHNRRTTNKTNNKQDQRSTLSHRVHEEHTGPWPACKQHCGKPAYCHQQVICDSIQY